MKLMKQNRRGHTNVCERLLLKALKLLMEMQIGAARFDFQECKNPLSEHFSQR